MGREQDEMVIAIAGQIGAGKTDLSKALSVCLDCSVASFGGYVSSVAEQRGVPPTRENLQRLGQTLLAEAGATKFVQAVLSSASPGSSRVTILDGVRHLVVWRALSASIPKSLLIYLDIPAEVRQARARDGGGEGGAGLRHPMEKEVPQLLEHADIVLTNASVQDWVNATIEKAVALGFMRHCF